jgi:hypothetical protein
MDAESFATWLDGIRSLTRDQCRKTFMMVALRDGDDDADWMGSEAVDETAMYEAPAMTTTRGGEAVVLPALPMGTDGKFDALTATAGRRVEARGCPHCDAKEVRPWGRAHGLPRYRSPDCRRTFNALSGTSLARLRHKDR